MPSLGVVGGGLKLPLVSESMAVVSGVVLAASIGVAMHTTETARQYYGETTPYLHTDLIGLPPVDVPDVTKVSGLLPMEAIELTSATSSLALLVQSDSLPGVGCAVTGDIAVKPGALVVLDLLAPCHANAEFELLHDGLIVSAKTDSAGRATLRVPALDQDAVLIADFDAETVFVTRADVPDAGSFTRTILQWFGPAGFQLHVREFGAPYTAGEQFHVGDAEDQLGEFLRIGSETIGAGYVAEVYSFPSQLNPGVNDVELTVEALVTEYNCGRDIEAQVIGLSGGTPVVRDLMLAMSDCESVGEYIVLNYPVPSTNVAAE